MRQAAPLPEPQFPHAPPAAARTGGARGRRPADSFTPHRSHPRPPPKPEAASARGRPGLPPRSPGHTARLPGQRGRGACGQAEAGAWRGRSARPRPGTHREGSDPHLGVLPAARPLAQVRHLRARRRRRLPSGGAPGDARRGGRPRERGRGPGGGGRWRPSLRAAAPGAARRAGGPGRAGPGRGGGAAGEAAARGEAAAQAPRSGGGASFTLLLRRDGGQTSLSAQGREPPHPPFLCLPFPPPSQQREADPAAAAGGGGGRDTGRSAACGGRGEGASPLSRGFRRSREMAGRAPSGGRGRAALSCHGRGEGRAGKARGRKGRC